MMIFNLFRKRKLCSANRIPRRKRTASAIGLLLLATAFGGPAPLDHPVALTQVPTDGNPGSMDAFNPSVFASGGRVVLLETDGRIRVLSTGFYSAADPAVSFDARKVLFAGQRNSSDPWNIYEINRDGSGLRQITRNHGNCRNPIYLSTLYTIVSTEPWYQLAFVSDFAGEIDPATGRTAFHIYSCKLDGGEVRRLTYSPLPEVDPHLMTDGRILFAGLRRSNPDHGRLGRMDLFTIASDGADLAAYTSPAGGRFKRMACQTDNGLVVFIESDAPARDGSGRLGSVQIRRNLNSYRPVASESAILYHSPSPLPSGRILVSGRSADSEGNFGLLILDPSDGSTVPLFDSENYHEIQARALTARQEPDGRSSVVTEKDPNGQLYALNVEISDLSDESWSMKTTIRRLRVLEGIPQTESTGDDRRQLPLHAKRILGEIPVEEDGSFFIEIPANIPVKLQLLDEDNMALRSCEWIWVRNHEPRGCIGCHEDNELTPPNRLVEAVKKPPRKLTLPPRRRRTVDFRRDVAPILEENCSNPKCHGAGAGLEFTGGKTDRQLYDRLLAGSKDSPISFAGRWVHPGRARTSPLIRQVFGKVTARPWDRRIPVPQLKGNRDLHANLLSEEEKQTLVEWIDLGAVFSIPAFRLEPAAAHTKQETGEKTEF